MNKYQIILNAAKSEKTFCLRVTRPDIRFKSGQCFNLGLPGMEINREYSIYSGSEDPYLDFLIRKVEGGLVSNSLAVLKEGDFIEVDGPYGEFCIPQNKLNSKFVFIASGTGIAPFHSFVKTHGNFDYKIIHGIRFSSERYDADDYEAGKYIPCISQNDGGESIRVTDYLLKNPVESDALIYLCGNRNMIIDSVQILLDQGINGDQIISEVFF